MMRIAVLLLFVVGYVALQLRLPASLPDSAPPRSFSADRAVGTLRRILGPGERPHPMGSDANASVAGRIVAELRESGYAPEVVEGTACGADATCGRPRNILVRGDDRQPRILLAAHYDSVPAGPGASDDGAGVATLLELARAIAAGAQVTARPWFLFTDGEEAGLLGAALFAQGQEREKLVPRFDFLLNADARGTGGPVFLFQSNPDSARAVHWYAQASRHPNTSSLLQAIAERLPNDTDFTVLDRDGAPGLNFAFIGHPLRYHTTADRVDHMDTRSVQQLGEQIFDLLSTPPPSGPDGRLVYFDVLGLAVARWGEGFNAFLAVAAFLACAAASVRLRPSRRAFVHAALACGAIPLAGLAAWPLMLLHPTPWAAAPLAFQCAALSLGVLVGVLASTPTPSNDAWAGTWTMLAALGIVLHLVLPGASFLLIVPSLVAGVAMLVGPAQAPALGGFVAALVLCEPALAIYDGLGREGLCALAMLAALATVASLPPWRPTPRAALFPAAALVVATLVAWRTPRITASDPAGVWRIARSHHATWMLGALSEAFVPPGATKLPRLEPPLPWQEFAVYTDTGTPVGAASEPGAVLRVEQDRLVIAASARPSRLALSLWLPRGVTLEMDGRAVDPSPEAGSLRATWVGGSAATFTVTGPEAPRTVVAELLACHDEPACSDPPPLPPGTAEFQMGTVLEVVYRSSNP
ncbi:M28 family peptidase [Pendulispora rubella]|uniref:M28 family peptidase n=1 Tax=Pendulispora rubella TaxID=2741070 RepID=A0ABZ2LDD3_9BACT